MNDRFTLQTSAELLLGPKFRPSPEIVLACSGGPAFKITALKEPQVSACIRCQPFTDQPCKVDVGISLPGPGPSGPACPDLYETDHPPFVNISCDRLLFESNCGGTFVLTEREAPVLTQSDAIQSSAERLRSCVTCCAAAYTAEQLISQSSCNGNA